MNDSIKQELKDAFVALYPSEKERLKSKSQLVREMFDDIEAAQKNGVKLTLLVSVIEQKCNIKISYQELKQILYRIRKERGLTKKRTLDNDYSSLKKPETKPETNDFEYTIENFQKIVNQLSKFNNPMDKFIFLGGKKEEIQGKAPSTHRAMYMSLRRELEQRCIRGF